MAFWLMLIPSAFAQNDGRPNILWILMEDVGPEMACYGEPLVSTPNIDRLAREGVRCTNAHTTAPVCSPSRSALITGMYQTTIGAHQRRNQVGHIVDVMATLVDIAGASYPKERAGVATQPMEGVSLRAAFDNQLLARKAPLFFEHDGSRAVRDGDWKLVSSARGEWELYHLAVDRTELNNLATKHPDKVKTLAARWDEWAMRTNVLPRPGGK
jgi:arylsulfatase A-like enzyme